MIELPADRASELTALNCSPAMLRVARRKLDRAGLTKIALKQSDMYALPVPARVCGLAMQHQVLRYIQRPAAAIAEASRVLEPDAPLLIVDFATHTFRKLRESYAHVRLTFSDGEIERWLTDAALALQSRITLPGQLAVQFWFAMKPSDSE